MSPLPLDHAYSWSVPPGRDARWEHGLLQRFAHLSAEIGQLGELEALAVQLGQLQRSMAPRLHRPQLALVMGDHGLATDGAPKPLGLSSAQLAQRICGGALPLQALATQHGIDMTVMDVGLADTLPPHPALLSRKVAHGTRHARMGPAMTRDQALAAIRIGAEWSRHLPGNALLCAGLGVGAAESAALVLARLTETPVAQLLPLPSNRLSEARMARQKAAAEGALARHPGAREPIEVLAALGGFETAAMVGLLLASAQSRRVIVIDGLPALAALMAASRLAPPVVDYCVFARSQPHGAIDQALSLFKAKPMLDVGLDTIDGMGALLAWPWLNSAAHCLSNPGLAAMNSPEIDSGPTAGSRALVTHNGAAAVHEPIGERLAGGSLSVQSELQFLPAAR